VATEAASAAILCGREDELGSAPLGGGEESLSPARNLSQGVLRVSRVRMKLDAHRMQE